MTPEQVGQLLGLPSAQAANILKNGMDFFAITPKTGVTPNVFVSNVAGTTQGAIAMPGGAQQVIVPNRSLWTPPTPVNSGYTTPGKIMMDKVQKLQEKARVLRELLEQHAKRDNDVAFVLDRMTPLLDDIDAGKVVPPKHDDFGRYFFNVEEQEPWFIKYPKLSHAEAEYAQVLQDWDFPPSA